MKKELILVIALIVLLSGCQQFLGTNKQTTEPTQSAFIGGTKGIEIGFAENQPPATILDNNQETFPISIYVRNKGEYDIPVNGLVASLTGIVQSTFALSSLNTRNNIEIYGASKEGGIVTPGTEEIVDFGEASFRTDLPGDTTYTLRADVCYNYQTKSVSKVCLKRDILKQDRIGSVCAITSALAAENSGAPIQVESAQESTVGSNKVKVAFKVVNKDIGAVFEPNTFAASCSGNEDEKDKLKVTVTNPERNFNIECPSLGNTNSGSIKLVNKMKDITCTISTSGMQEATFQDLIIVQLDYMYRQAVQIPLRISSEG